MAHLVVIMACIAAATIVAATAADHSTGRGQGTGRLCGAARLLEGEGPGRLWRRVMDVVDKVVGVGVGVAMLRAHSLLGGRCLQAAGVRVAQGQVAGGRPSTWGVLLAAGGQAGQGGAGGLSGCARQSRPAVI